MHIIKKSALHSSQYYVPLCKLKPDTLLKASKLINRYLLRAALELLDLAVMALAPLPILALVLSLLALLVQKYKY